MIDYTKNEWRDGTTPITAEKLNNIEDGIKKTVDATNEIMSMCVKPCDVTNKITELVPDTDNSEIQWKATEDCWLSFYVSGSRNDNQVSTVKVNGVIIFSAAMDSRSTGIYNTFTFPPSFFVKADATIIVTRGEPEITCTVYGCL